MKRLVGVSFAFALLAAVVAADSVTSPPPTPSTPPPSTAPAPPPTAAPRHPRAHFFVGEVVEIVAPENRFSVRETLRDGSPKVTFFTAEASTTVSRGKEPATFADLRVNDHVTIKYTETSGARKTLSIRITPSRQAKTAPAPAKPPE